MSDPDVTQAELDAVSAALCSTHLSHGPRVEAFEEAFAGYTGRKFAVAVSNGTMGMLLALRAHGIGPGDEVLTSAYSWRETAHAITLTGATPVFVDVDYWSGVIVADKVAARITPQTKAILAGNTNGHPAPWGPLRELSQLHGVALLEDSTEAIGSSIGNGSSAGSATARCSIFPSHRRCAAGKAAWWSPMTPPWPVRCAITVPISKRIAVPW